MNLVPHARESGQVLEALLGHAPISPGHFLGGGRAAQSGFEHLADVTDA